MPKSPHFPDRRINVSLCEGDPLLLEKLRTVYEGRKARRMSWAEVFRTTLYNQAKAEGVITEDFFNEFNR